MNRETVLRCFCAIGLSDEVRTALARVQQELAETDVPVRWVPPECLHLTLVFYGEITPDLAAELARDLETRAAAMPPFELDVCGLGCFGPPTAPRVIWAGARETPHALQSLQHGLSTFARGQGLDTDDRPYTAHITLGRGQRRRRTAALTVPLDSYRNFSFGSMSVSRVSLMRSERVQGGVRYTAQYTAVLKGAGKDGQGK